MTVQTTTSRADYTGNGSTTAFTVPFYFLDNTHVLVIRTQISTGTATTLALTTDYTVSGAGVGSGGTVTCVTAPTTDQKISILRNVPLTQLTHYVDNDPFPAASHEKALDQLTMEIQQLQEAISRSIKISQNNTISSPEMNLSAAMRANMVIAFDSNGDISVTTAVGNWKGNWTSGAAYVQRDIIKDTSNGNIYICLTGHTSSGSQPISTNTDAAKWALLVDAATATTAATNAANSATAAASSASSASSSASSASTSASNASTSASNASTSATNAASSASSASTSATNAGSSATAAAASASAAAAAVQSALWRDVVFVTSANSPITIAQSDNGKLYCVDTSGGAVTVNLPTIASITTPFNVSVKKETGDANSITVNRGGTDTIDGSTSKVIGVAGSGATLIADADPSPDQWTAADFGATAGNMVKDTFSGNASTTNFTLSAAPASVNNVAVYIGGVRQTPTTDYTVSSTTLTFTSAPPTGTNNILVISGTTLSIGTPADGTVTTAKMVDGAVTAQKMASGAAASNLGFTPVNKAGDTLTGALNGAGDVSLASASTVAIGAAASNGVTITGTTTITAFDTIAAGAVRRLTFAAALTLTHNGTSLILPSGANITTAAGDVAEFVSLGSGNWRCFNYMKASGQAVVAPAAGVTNVATGNGLTGGPITSTGTISLDFYTGTTANNSSYPIGSYLLSAGNSVVMNASVSPLYTGGGGSPGFVYMGNPGGSPTSIAGTWRVRGTANSGCYGGVLLQRAA